MLDIITLISATTPKEYVVQCLRSIQVAAQYTTYPVCHHKCQGVPGHIGQAMVRALTHCHHPYVAFVDDDDFVLPNAFECLGSHFASGPTAVCARELQISEQCDAQHPNHARHHLTAYARPVLDCVDLASLPASIPPVLLATAATRGRVIDVMQWVYIYRRRHSAGADIRAGHNHVTNSVR